MRRLDGRPGPDRFALAVAAILACDLIFGGATVPDSMSSTVARIASLPLLVIGLQRLRWTELDGGARAGLCLLVAMVAIPLIQCIPLPPQVWERFPGRASIQADYHAAGVSPPWLPLSLSPYETGGALFWFIPPAAMFLAALSVPERARAPVALAIPAIAVLAVALGMLQVLGGPESHWRFYSVTNIESAVGFFANRNHQAALLVVGLALAPLSIAAASEIAPGAERLGVIAAALVEVILVVGIGVARSRAGVLIGLPVFALAPMVIMRLARSRTSRRAAFGLLIAAVFGAALVGVFARVALVKRFDTPLATEGRIQVVPAVRRAANLYFPAGSGLGSFDPIYRQVEPIGSVTEVYLNHAHDDALEILVETGALGIAVLVVFLIWWLWLTAVVLVRGTYTSGEAVAAASSLAIGALLAHSTVDYPLRTTAMASVFALACGLLAASRRVPAR